MKAKWSFLSRVLLVGLALALTASARPNLAGRPDAQAPLAPQAALGTAFTYQGYLTRDGNPVDGLCDLGFDLYGSASGTDKVGSTQSVHDATVSEGYFTVALNGGGEFGAEAFTGQARWLEIAVDCGGGPVSLSPRVALNPAPYALALPGLWTQQNATSPNIIGGYSGNSVTSGVMGATIGGGGQSGYVNRVTDDYGTVGGGYRNTASGNWATVGGGSTNTASGNWATVGGGSTNTASAGLATVGGGYNNTASGYGATVGGGDGNTASGDGATVGGGGVNTASGEDATVGGGAYNTASGYGATVPGGLRNTAQGAYSFAAGHRAQAYNRGCFVLADATDADESCVDDNRFVFRVTNAFYIWTTADHSVGTVLPTGGSGWSPTSDRAAKANFAPVDGRDILRRLASVPVETWNFRSQDPSIRHIGAMGQDFHAAFGVGEDDKHINTVDADGVALAAIQGLYQLSQEQAAHIEGLEAENGELRSRMEDLQQRLEALERGGGLSHQAQARLPAGGWLGLAGLLVGLGIALSVSKGPAWMTRRKGGGR